jgi:AbrB family looped-hinge helix DNA binding protein
MKKLISNEFITWVTVSSRGQIVIPKEIRKKLKIKTGDRLLTIQRKNQDGLNLIKSQAVDEAFEHFNN